MSYVIVVIAICFYYFLGCVLYMLMLNNVYTRILQHFVAIISQLGKSCPEVFCKQKRQTVEIFFLIYLYEAHSK